MLNTSCAAPDHNRPVDSNRGKHRAVPAKGDRLHRAGVADTYFPGLDRSALVASSNQARGGRDRRHQADGNGPRHDRHAHTVPPLEAPRSLKPGVQSLRDAVKCANMAIPSRAGHQRRLEPANAQGPHILYFDVLPELFACLKNVIIFSRTIRKNFRVSSGIEFESVQEWRANSFRRAIFAVEAIQHLDICRRQKVRGSSFREEPLAQSVRGAASRLVLRQCS